MIQAVRGTKDLLPDVINNWLFVENKLRETSAKYGYQEIRTPIFEKTEVFSRGVGEQTDIVNKEMYTFEDKGGESITLRPEMTASLVRAVIQNSLLNQASLLKLWYFGPFFRFERPQKGRLRQFHQYGAECIGSPYPESDAEVIMLADSIIKSLNINDYTLLLNSIGNNTTRYQYKSILVEYLKTKINQLSSESRKRLETNPLRILDSKEQSDIEIINQSPSILDFLDNDSKIHFDTVCSLLDLSNIKYTIEPRLVRGLDYYCHTVFEFRHSSLGAQDSFGGGGRYDTLFEQLGAKSTPAIGFAMGIERILLILENINAVENRKDSCDIYLIRADDKAMPIIINLAKELRELGYRVETDMLRRSLKAQFRDANRLSAVLTLIIGEEELKNGNYTIKEMSSGEQKSIKNNELLLHLKDYFKRIK